MVQFAVQAPMTVRWKLNQFMFERGIKNADLVELTGFHPNTISKLKNLREMPDRLEKETLNALCRALQCQPGDLMTYISDDDEQLEVNDD